jgi:hypothetical protein
METSHNVEQNIKDKERHDWKFYMHLPRRKREFALFMVVISPAAVVSNFSLNPFL